MITVKQLQGAWVDYFKVAIYQGQRFGQYIYNEYGYQANDSYMQSNNDAAYKLLFDSLTISVADI